MQAPCKIYLTFLIQLCFVISLVAGADGKKLKFFVETGPYLSLLTKPVDAYGFVGSLLTIQPFNGDVSAVVGADINVPLPHRFALGFEVRNNIGLTKVFSNFKTYSPVLLSGFTYTFGKSVRRSKK